MNPIEKRPFRDALGQFATGVTLITTVDAEQNPVGMTANSFSSLSLEPPLVLWSIAKSSSNYPVFAEANHFAIHILEKSQTEIAQQFARKDIDRFEGIEIEKGIRDTPVLTRFLSRFECATECRYDGGDHLILVGRVQKLDTQAGAPLIFFGGKFAQLNDS